MAVNKQLGKNNPGSKVAYQEISPNDMADPRMAKLNALLLQICQGVNYALGYSGTVVLITGLQLNGDLNMNGHAVDQASQLGISPSPIPVTGSKGGNAALASLIAAMVKLGLIVDQTT
jgi:hypothetical protein